MEGESGGPAEPQGWARSPGASKSLSWTPTQFHPSGSLHLGRSLGQVILKSASPAPAGPAVLGSRGTIASSVRMGPLGGGASCHHLPWQLNFFQEAKGQFHQEA